MAKKNKTKFIFWSGLVKVRSYIQLRCFGVTLNGLFLLENQCELKEMCKEKWAIVPSQSEERLTDSYHKRLTEAQPIIRFREQLLFQIFQCSRYTCGFNVTCC